MAVVQWLNGLPSGNGKMEFDDNSTWTYDGNWADGRIDGKGVYQSPAFGVYEGDWVTDQREGEGKMTFASGWTYEGKWKVHNKLQLEPPAAVDGNAQ
jgi:hypothetical protein